MNNVSLRYTMQLGVRGGQLFSGKYKFLGQLLCGDVTFFADELAFVEGEFPLGISLLLSHFTSYI